MKKHVDTVIILGGILGAVLWMNGKFENLKREILKVKETVIKITSIKSGSIISNQ